MKNKATIIKTLKEAALYEEAGVAIYSQNLASILQWTGLSEQQQTAIYQKINKLLEQTRHHRELLGEIITSLEK